MLYALCFGEKRWAVYEVNLVNLVSFVEKLVALVKVLAAVFTWWVELFNSFISFTRCYWDDLYEDQGKKV